MDSVKAKLKIRKQAFYEVGKGKFARQAQAAFEQAQITACERNLPVKITLEITVFPPQDENWGAIITRVQVKEPPVKSIKYDAEFGSGLIISSGQTMADALAQELEFPEVHEPQNTTPFAKKVGEA